MNKIFSFMAGAICGALIGSVTALLLTPASGQQLKDDVVYRWETAKEDAVRAKEETRLQLEAEYRQKVSRKEPTT